MWKGNHRILFLLQDKLSGILLGKRSTCVCASVNQIQEEIKR